MRVGTVVRLWRYPVKSMGGEALERAHLTSRGILGDRRWAVWDEARQGITNAKRLPALRGCTARHRRETPPGSQRPPVEITLPDGSVVATDAPEVPHLLSQFLGRTVDLRTLGETGHAAAARISTRDEPAEVVRTLMGVLPDEPLPDVSAFPPERLRLLREDNFFDALPIHLLTSTTLHTLSQHAPESIWDERRFRPNVFLASDDPDGYPELSWLGARLRIGEALIEATDSCPRCVMVTQPADELPADSRVMRALVRHARHVAGIYARVIEEGPVRIGDEVSLESHARR